MLGRPKKVSAVVRGPLLRFARPQKSGPARCVHFFSRGRRMWPPAIRIRRPRRGVWGGSRRPVSRDWVFRPDRGAGAGRLIAVPRRPPEGAFLLAGARYARLRAEWALRSSRVVSARALERTSARFLRREALSNSSSAASGACSGDFSELKMARPGGPACLFDPN